jgi:hypothetical protein
MAGGLTPFIGAGMSMRDRGGGLAGWEELVCGLEAAAAFPAAHGVLGDELVVRADRAATRLRVEGRLPAAIREHLGTLESIDVVPQQTMALAGLRCPLVISTNYDDVYLAAAVQQSRKNRQESPRHDRQEPSGDDQEAPIVVGRGAADCRRVLRSLRTPDHPMIWQSSCPSSPSMEYAKPCMSMRLGNARYSADSGVQRCNLTIGQLTNIEPSPLPLPHRGGDPDGAEVARRVA